MQEPKKQTLHISKLDGTPKKCVAKPGNCPYANPLAHFQEAEKAQAFSDKYNQLWAEGLDYAKYDPDKDIHTLDDAELVYISEHIKEHAKENDEYSDYHNKVRWQITNRNKALSELKGIDSNQKALLRKLEDTILSEKLSRFDEKYNRNVYLHKEGGETVALRFSPNGYELPKRYDKYFTKDEDGNVLFQGKKFTSSFKGKEMTLEEVSNERKSNIERYAQYKQERVDLFKKNVDYARTSSKEYDKALEKKDKAEDIIIPHLEKRIRHKAILDVEENVDNEIELRYAERNDPLPEIIKNKKKAEKPKKKSTTKKKATEPKTTKKK